MAAKRALAMNTRDNVAVALEHIEAGDEVNVQVKGEAAKSVRAADRIPFGFKIAMRDISIGDDVIKYGEVIGRAASAVGSGEQVHVHNVKGVRVQSEIGGGEGQ